MGKLKYDPEKLFPYGFHTVVRPHNLRDPDSPTQKAISFLQSKPDAKRSAVARKFGIKPATLAGGLKRNSVQLARDRCPMCSGVCTKDGALQVRAWLAWLREHFPELE